MDAHPHLESFLELVLDLELVAELALDLELVAELELLILMV